MDTSIVLPITAHGLPTLDRMPMATFLFIRADMCLRWKRLSSALTASTRTRFVRTFPCTTLPGHARRPASQRCSACSAAFALIIVWCTPSIQVTRCGFQMSASQLSASACRERMWTSISVGKKMYIIRATLKEACARETTAGACTHCRTTMNGHLFRKIER